MINLLIIGSQKVKLTNLSRRLTFEFDPGRIKNLLRRLLQHSQVVSSSLPVRIRILVSWNDFINRWRHFLRCNICLKRNHKLHRRTHSFLLLKKNDGQILK